MILNQTQSIYKGTLCSFHCLCSEEFLDQLILPRIVACLKELTDTIYPLTMDNGMRKIYPRRLSRWSSLKFLKAYELLQKPKKSLRV